MKKLNLTPKKHFIFPNQQCTIYLSRSFSNIFVTLLDYNGKVVICKTSGSCGVGNSKRKKTAHQAIEKIVDSLKAFFVLYDLKQILVTFPIHFMGLVYPLAKQINLTGLKIVGLKPLKLFAHNGMRGRKLRRV